MLLPSAALVAMRQTVLATRGQTAAFVPVPSPFLMLPVRSSALCPLGAICCDSLPKSTQDRTLCP